MAIDDEDDNASLTPEGTLEQSQDDGDRPQAATPDQEDRADIASAAAEISVIGRREGQNGQQQTMDNDAMEMVDESGELVQQAFLQFLQD